MRESPRKNEEETKKDKSKIKMKKTDDEYNEKPKINLSATYKLSVLPDERILDCLSFEATQYEP